MPGPRAQILFLGRIVPEKGIDLLISALSCDSLRARFTLKVAGPDEDAGYLRKLLRMGVENGVPLDYVGTLTGDAKEDALACCDLVALVSEYESWGKVISEALNVGTRVLVSDTCGIADDVSPREGLIVRRSVSAVRGALERLSDNHFAILNELLETCYPASTSLIGTDLIDLIAGYVSYVDRYCCDGTSSGYESECLNLPRPTAIEIG